MANEETKPAADPTAESLAELTKRFKTESEKHAFQKKRADALEKEFNSLKKKHDELLKSAEGTVAVPLTGSDYVALQGEVYDIAGTFRADSNFIEVKRGYCPEGVTLVAISKPH